jgi:hypothetical protein
MRKLCAQGRTRTDDLRITNALLYQLSHLGVSSMKGFVDFGDYFGRFLFLFAGVVYAV